MNPRLTNHPRPRVRGFALVVSLTMLVLLTVIAVGLLSLSAITLRTATQSSAKAEAQANARLALMIAIGELQKQMGPDQRISANGSIMSQNSVLHPHWTGAWDSWVAGDPAAASVNDNYPGQPSAHQTIGSQPDASMRPEYADKNNHFRAWLLSLDPEEAKDPMAPLNLSLTGLLRPNNDERAVQLVGAGSLGANGNPAEYVNARLINISHQTTGGTTGRYGWWVGDESVKARITDDSYEAQTSLTRAEEIFRIHAPASTGTLKVPGLEDITNDSQLGSLPSLASLDLVSGVAGRPAQNNFHHTTPYSMNVLADVREGGLKRDLSTLLEQPINLNDTGDPYMLYRFDSAGEDRVPIQDLSAYYQLYANDPNWSNGRRGGIEHNPAASRVMQVRVPDYGSPANRTRFLREYTALYRNPVPIRVQFVLGVGATRITDAERTAINARNPTTPLRATDQYKMLLGVKPVVTLWNPNNVPMVMGTGATQRMSVGFPPFALRWTKYRAAGNPASFQSTRFLNLNYAISNESTHSDARARSLGPYIMQLQFARDREIVFQPGEAKMFSIPINPQNFLETGGNSVFGNTPLYQAADFLPDGFYVVAKTAPPDGIDVVHFPNSAGTFQAYQGYFMVFGDGDNFDFQVVPEGQSPRALAISSANEVRGSGFQFWMAHANYVTNTTAHFRNYQFISRFGGPDQPTNPNNLFSSNLMLAGFPSGQPIPYQGQTNALPGNEIFNATSNGEAKGLLLFTMMAGAEVHTMNSPGAGAGRRVTTRPFLHGSTLSAPQMSDSARSALYDYGWEWQVDRINDVEEAFQDDGASRGYHGGGYTVETGVTHVVQQYLPVLPPISIASLSSARLGGFSLANAPVMATGTTDVQVGGPSSTGTLRDAPNPGDFRQVTATGQGGLAPHTLHAIGNSYAHPNVPANKAFTTYNQLLNSDTDAAAPPQRTYADHSYLVNKALWDDYFFSSITPRPSTIPLFGGSTKTAQDVAREFLWSGAYLPDRRLVPYKNNTNQDDFNQLLSEYNSYENGFADRIASHMMLVGPFNINSTSVDAWKTVFSSLSGKPLTFLEDNASRYSSLSSDDTPVSPGMLANGRPIASGDLSGDPNDPPEQWNSARVITDQEIDQLARAMVRQVKLRGPFLSLSEFINRRLDGNNLELALKGALQAALDDENVSINAAFRTPARSLDGEITGMTAPFPQALRGPIAYGSTPYVDQADILRHMGGTLTPRGDTFVIRTYGDSLDRNGKVLARAWCEAVVQRVPDYTDLTNQPHEKQAALSDANRKFGRQFQIIYFRWLTPGEV